MNSCDRLVLRQEKEVLLLNSKSEILETSF